MVQEIKQLKDKLIVLDVKTSLAIVVFFTSLQGGVFYAGAQTDKATNQIKDNKEKVEKVEKQVNQLKIDTAIIKHDVKLIIKTLEEMKKVKG